VIIDTATAVLDVIGGLYVQDIDAEPEDGGEKDKLEFKQDCLDFVLCQLFDDVKLAENIAKELGMFTSSPSGPVH
jgi:hypothetical protein